MSPPAASGRFTHLRQRFYSLDDSALHSAHAADIFDNARLLTAMPLPSCTALTQRLAAVRRIDITTADDA